MTQAIVPAVLDAVPDPMVFIDGDGFIGHANPAALAQFGDWIIGRDHGTVLRHPSLLEKIDAVAQDQARAAANFEQTGQFGTTNYTVRITAIEASTGRAMLLHFTDVTHLGEVEGLRRDFVANVSHELRTPLTSMMGFIETLRGPARDDADAQTRFLTLMAEEASRMDRLISDLLSLSRVEATQRKRPSEQVDVTALLRSVVTSLAPRAERAGNTLILNHNDAPDVILGDRDQLTQVFLNLTENALKYGGGDKPVTIMVTRNSQHLQVDVIDEGEGIDSQHLPRLTERFYRVDGHRARTMGGTGLGLAIVKHIINRHRGRLKISSVPGQGSTFSVLFPVDLMHTDAPCHEAVT